MSTFTDAQKLAIAAEGNVLVSAGAGTGKTRTVVERCLRLIENGCSLENILMVTFTEAAAAEMRARIRKTLEDKIANWRGELHESLNDQSGTRGSRPSRGTFEEQLALLDTAHISTLHGFCLQLIRDHFHDLHIDPQVNVLDDAQTVPLMHEALDHLLERCYTGEGEYAAEVQRLVRQSGGADESIRALVLKLHRYTQSLPPSEQWYERELTRLDAEAPAHWREWLLDGFIAWRDEWLPDLREVSESKNVAACIAAVGELGRAATFQQIAEAMRCVIAAYDDKWPGPYTKTEYGYPLKSFFDDAKFFLSLTEPREGRDPLLEDWQWSRGPLRALLRLAQDFTKEFTRAKRALGGVDFADLEQLALQLLVNESGAPTDIAYTWQERFACVFVDECQDINAAQDAIIRAVNRSAGNRFLVGDVKQSIYRFRLADPSIFRHYEEQWRIGNGGQRIPLADNFRSREGILGFINPLFATLMRSSIGGVSYDTDAQLRFGAPDRRAPLSAASDPGPRVELHVIHKLNADVGTNGEEGNGFESSDGAGGESGVGAPVEDVLAIEKEARLVAHRLREMRDNADQIWDEDKKSMRAVDWRDMVVLLRSPASRVETFAKEFSRAGVPLAAARAGFYSAIEVQDLLNLLRLLDNPLQDIPFAAVLRSPLVAMSADELGALRIGGARGEQRATFVSAANQFYYKAGSDELPISDSARAKLKTFYLSFERWRTLIRQTSVSHCLETVLAETHYEALLLAQPRGRERVANVHRLLELARQYDPFQRQGLYRFLRFVSEQQDAGLDQEAAVLETANAVRLMSIHQSKGLEFPVVVVACLAAQFNTQDLRGEMLLSSEFGLCAKIVPPHIEQRYPSLPWWLARRRESRELLGEEMRLLYVAMTRARDTLVLTAFEKSRDAGARWHLGPSALGDRALLKSQSYFGWLRRWLGANTSDAHWSNDRSGSTEWLRWTLHPEDGAEFAATLPRITAAAADEKQAPLDVDALRARLTWRYPHDAATKEPAKTNVSVLRRRATEEDDESRQLFHPRRSARRTAQLTAAQIGSAHHLFMQHVAFARAGSILDLRNEAERLVQESHLTSLEATALDFDALLSFWTSDEGRRVVSKGPFVHRELPFTGRFTPNELRGMGLAAVMPMSGEFVIVQGVVDLAVISEEGIEILDFKTDHARGDELAAKAAAYAPQVRLYAAALRAIYGRPVRKAALHFLAAGETLPVDFECFGEERL